MSAEGPHVIIIIVMIIVLFERFKWSHLVVPKFIES